MIMGEVLAFLHRYNRVVLASVVVVGVLEFAYLVARTT